MEQRVELRYGSTHIGDDWNPEIWYWLELPEFGCVEILPSIDPEHTPMSERPTDTEMVTAAISWLEDKGINPQEYYFSYFS